MKAGSLLYILLVLSLPLKVITHTCSHVPNENLTLSNNDKHYLLKESSSSSDITQSSQFRLTYDRTELDALKDKTIADQITNAIQNAQNFFQDLIKVVKPHTSPIEVVDTDCLGYSFRKYPKIQNSDFHIYIKLENNNDDTLASSTACQLNPQLGRRPELGVIIFNTHYLQATDKSFYSFSKVLKITIHEIFHALVFSPPLFSHFDIATNSFTQGDLQVSFPNVIQWAKNHFNCQDIDSLSLETNGSSGSKGSHWSRDLLHHDIMTASSMLGNMVWSGINNALLNDSGWYIVDNQDTKSERNLWGHNKGCSFLKSTSTCSEKGGENCVADSTINSFNFSGKGKCTASTDEFTTCGYVVLFSNTECQNPNNNFAKTSLTLFSDFNVVFGSTSAAFTSTLTPNSYKSNSETILCYPQTCSSDNKSISIQFGDYTLNCKKDGEVLPAPSGSNFRGTLTCPGSINTFCLKQTQCDQFCSSNGYCRNRVCNCLDNYSGNTCECSSIEGKSSPSCNKKQVANCILYGEDANCLKCGSNHSLIDSQCAEVLITAAPLLHLCFLLIVGLGIAF